MIAGHLSLAYAVRAVRRDAPLALLLVAAVLPDIADLTYSTLAICSVKGTYSHAYPALAVLAALAAVVAYAITKRPGVAVWAAVAVLLHSPADWITGEKYVWAGGPIIGANLYRWPWADFLVEAPLVVLGWLALRKSGAGPGYAVRRWAVVGLIALQAGMDVTIVVTRPIGTAAHRRACGPDY
jgi:hypothetical protein